MSTFAKVLVFFNLLLAGGVVYFGTQSWAQRQEQNSIALRYYMVLRGLPMDEVPGNPTGQGEDEEVPVSFEMAGGQKVESLRMDFYKKHFQGADGTAYAPAELPTSRLAELKRVRAKVQTALEAKTPALKLAYLIGTVSPITNPAPRPVPPGTPILGLEYTPGLLVYLANTYEERLALKQLLVPAGLPPVEKAAKDFVNSKIAEELLYKHFDALIAPPDPASFASKRKAVEEALTTLDKTDKTLKDEYGKRDKALLAALDATTKFGMDIKSDELKTEMKEADDAFQKTVRDYDDAHKAWVKALTSLSNAVLQAGTTPAPEGTEKLDSAARPYDESDRRLRMATLLMHLDFDDPKDAWQKRVALVIGLPDYLAAIKYRSERLIANGGYTASIKQQRDQIEARFAETYQYLQTAASYRDYLLEAQQKITKSLLDQTAKEEILTAQRQAQWKEAKRDLDVIVAKVDRAILEQTSIENELFQIQKLVGQVLRQNFGLEDRIEAAEKTYRGTRQ